MTAFAVAMAVLIVTLLAVIASDTFEDVSDSNIFHEDIGWLAEAQVTLGCNPPDNDQFCPRDNVTRQQMAAFMRRLAENQVVDVGSVEGRTAAELTPLVSYASALDSVDFPGNFDVITVRTVTVDAPGAGALVLVARGDIVANGATVSDDHQFACWVDTDPNSLDSNQGAHVSVANGTVISGNVFATNLAITRGQRWLGKLLPPLPRYGRRHGKPVPGQQCATVRHLLPRRRTLDRRSHELVLRFVPLEVERKPQLVPQADPQSSGGTKDEQAGPV